MPSPLPTTPYLRQAATWPSPGKHILAHYDDETIIVYQAYRDAIADYALAHWQFGGDFQYTRMSWIKTNFLWMMYRSGWGQKPGQKRILAVRITRVFYDWILREAVSASYQPQAYATIDEWREDQQRHPVRFQWDPDYRPNGRRAGRRALQLGLQGTALEAYGLREIREVIDMSEFVAKQREGMGPRYDPAKLRMPVERVYLPEDEGVRRKLGIVGSPYDVAPDGS